MTQIIPNNGQTRSEVSSVALRSVIASTCVFVRPLVLTAVLLRFQVFWDVTPRVVVSAYRPFGGLCRLLRQDIVT